MLGTKAPKSEKKLEEVKEAQVSQNQAQLPRNLNNSDIKEVMTNTSADKSQVTENGETRIKTASLREPIDLIREYRQTILQRYNQKMGEEEPSHASQSYITPFVSRFEPFIPTKLPENEESKVSEAVEADTRPVNNAPEEPERKNAHSRKPQEERKRPRSCKKSARATNLEENTQFTRTKSRHRGSVHITESVHNKSMRRPSSKRKTNVKKRIEQASNCLTLGELISFFKVRRPTKEDLNMIQMLMILVFSHMRSQLFKIGVGSPEDVKNVTWKAGKTFFETHVKTIVPILKSFSKRFYGEQKQEMLRLLIVMSHQKLHYEGNFASPVVCEFLDS
jgi:hypothetical protein